MANKVTTEFVADTKGAQGDLKALAKETEKAESAGKALASELRALADKADAEFADMQAASGAMSAALGEDFVRARTEAGGSVDVIVQGLREMGLSFDDIRADADQLGDAIKRLDDSKGSFKGLGDTARGTSVDIDRVRDSGDQSRSVLANMVGNSTQDLAGLGAVGGTVGMALGQLGEYATEGNIKLSSLAKIAGPMAGVSLAVIGVSAAMKVLGKDSKDAAEAAKSFLKVQEAIKAGKFDAAATEITESYGATIRELEKLGFSYDDVIGHILGFSSIMPELSSIVDEHTTTMDEGGLVLDEYGQHVNDVVKNLNEATTANAEQAAALGLTDETQRKVEASLSTLIGTTAEASGTVRTLSKDRRDDIAATIDAARETRDAAAATRELDDAYKAFMGSLDQEDAFANFQEAMWNYRSEIEHSDQSTRDYKRAIAETIIELDNISGETKTSLLAELDTGSIAIVENYLNGLKIGVNVPIRLTPTGDPLNRDGQGRVYGATGGIVTRPTVATIGEAGPEAVIPLNRTPGSSPLGGLNLGGGGLTVNVYAQGAIGLNPMDIQRFLVTNLKRWQSRGGQV